MCDRSDTALVEHLFDYNAPLRAGPLEEIWVSWYLAGAVGSLLRRLKQLGVQQLAVDVFLYSSGTTVGQLSVVAYPRPDCNDEMSSNERQELRGRVALHTSGSNFEVAVRELSRLAIEKTSEKGST